MFRRRNLDVLFGMAVTALSLAILSGCGDETQKPTPRGPGLVQVQTAADLADAFRTAVAGDTIQILSGFAGTTFTMTHGLTLGADRAPILIYGDSRAAFRPRLVFPDTADGITIRGHTVIRGRSTTLRNLDIDGGMNGLVMEDAKVDVDRCRFTNSLRDGIAATGAGATGLVSLSFFDRNNRFGISTGSNAALTIERNTVVRAGDCGLYIDSNAIVRANNIFQAHQYGIILQSHAPTAVLTCNNSFASEIGPNYVSATITVDPELNIERDPLFCGLGVYSIRSGSPLAALNSPTGCGTIGAFEPECD